MLPKSEMSELLQFRPHPIGDPVPWIIVEHLEKEQIMQIARIQLEYQIAINQAFGKALQNVSEVLGAKR